MAEPTPRLKCVTFNVLHGGVFSGRVGNGEDLEHRLAMIVEELRTVDADIIGLQEASTGNARGNVAKRVAAQLGLHYVYSPAAFRLFASEWVNAFVGWVMNFTEGPAILSRFPISAWKTYDLPRCDRFTDPRVLLCADLQTPWGAIRACSTHISNDLCQARGVVDVVRQQQHSLPLLLMGDFNALEDSPAITILKKELELIDTFRVANPTAPGLTVWQRVYAPRPTVFRRVDYVLFRPGKKQMGRVLNSKVILNTPGQLPDGRTVWPSDHYGVLTELELSSATGEKGELGCGPELC